MSWFTRRCRFLHQRSKKKTALALAGELMPGSRPDLDNFIKAALDGCNEIVFKDDSLVVTITATKRYSDRPALTITVELSDPDFHEVAPLPLAEVVPLYCRKRWCRPKPDRKTEITAAVYAWNTLAIEYNLPRCKTLTNRRRWTPDWPTGG